MTGYDDLRDEVAVLLGIAPDEVDPDESLLDLGIDSLRLMALFVALDGRGMAVDYGMFLEQPTMNGIWAAAGLAGPQ